MKKKKINKYSTKATARDKHRLRAQATASSHVKDGFRFVDLKVILYPTHMDFSLIF